MQSEAFGEIGLLPEVFRKMRMTDYFLLRKGFENKRVYEQDVVRRAVAIVISPWLKQAISSHKLWPLPGDMTSEISSASQKLLKKLKENDITYIKMGGKIVEVINKPKEN